MRPLLALAVAMAIGAGLDQAPAQCEVTTLLPADSEPDEYFGWSIASSADGNVAVVSALWDDHGGPYSGAAYVFVRSGQEWLEHFKLTASDAAPEDYFGESVALSADGSTCLVGSMFDDTEFGFNAGSAYVFVREGEAWVQESKLVAEDAAASDWFGLSVALSADGNTALVGGSVSVFVRVSTQWVYQAKVTAPISGEGWWFGEAVAIDAAGEAAMIGAPGTSGVDGPAAGLVHVLDLDRCDGDGDD